MLHLASTIWLPEIQDVDGSERVTWTEAGENLTDPAAGYLEGLVKYLPPFVYNTLHFS